MTGFGGIVSFELDGIAADVAAFVSSRRFFALGESLGGVKSLICHPARMTHASIPAAARARARPFGLAHPAVTGLRTPSRSVGTCSKGSRRSTTPRETRRSRYTPDGERTSRAMIGRSTVTSCASRPSPSRAYLRGGGGRLLPGDHRPRRHESATRLEDLLCRRGRRYAAYAAVLARIWHEGPGTAETAVRLVRHRCRLPHSDGCCPVGPDSDMVRYLWDGRVQLLGYNPYRVLPSDPAMAHTHTDQTVRMPSRRRPHPISAGGAAVLPARRDDCTTRRWR